MSAYEEQDRLLSERLRELVRLAGAGGLSDVAGEPGGPFAPGTHLTPAASHVHSPSHWYVPAQQGGGPEEPELPDGPQAPDLPRPEAPEAPEAPEPPAIPEAPELPDVPDILRSPEIPPAPEIPPTPYIPPAPEFPEMPEFPEAPEIPESPGIYDQPVIPDPPRIDDPELPEVDLPAQLPGTPGDPASPDAPDLPRSPEFPDAPPPAPDGPDAVLDAVTAMYSNHPHDYSQLGYETGQFGHEGPMWPGGRAHSEPPGQWGPSPGQPWAENATLALPALGGPALGGHGGPYGFGGGLPGTGGGGGRGDDASGGAHGDGDGEDGGDDSEVEAALRRMLHECVRDIQPAPGSLDHLRQAVPARRVHRRRALVGAAAAVVLVGVGIPGLVSAGLIPGLQGDSSYNAGENHDQSQSAGGSGTGGHTQGAGSVEGGTQGSGAEGGHGPVAPSSTQGKSGGGGHNDGMSMGAPGCGRQQLGDGDTDVGSPGDGGKVYGSFRVVNTSAEACTVYGEGEVAASARGRADSERIDVVEHTQGDAATGLPDPDVAVSALVLRPGQAYEVKWAWVPSACDRSGPKPGNQGGVGPGRGQGGNNADSGGYDDGVSSGDDDGGAGDDGAYSAEGEYAYPAPGGDNVDPGGGTGRETDNKASVVLSHIPDEGDPPAANTELEGACAGTLYRTGVLAAGKS